MTASAAPALSERELDEINDRFESTSPEKILEWATSRYADDTVLTCSFQHEGVALAHMLRTIKSDVPIVFINTRFHFKETIEFRDSLMQKTGAKLIVGSVQQSIDEGKVMEEKGFTASRNALQTVTLLESLEAGKYDAAMGGARRDEEKARAKERFFSHRDEFGQWDPKNQRPELWNTFNGRKHLGEHFRVFPISNWTEMDIWQYILVEHRDPFALFQS